MIFGEVGEMIIGEGAPAVTTRGIVGVVNVCVANAKVTMRGIAPAVSVSNGAMFPPPAWMMSRTRIVMDDAEDA
jgi:hypothetical protein